MNKELQQSSFLYGIKTLVYHRVDTSESDPWSICVSIKNFEKQLQFFKNNFNIISSDELIKQVASEEIKENSICITFDDGYADNYTNAKPILEKYNCPATFFISTAFTGSSLPFWWDELEIILLRSPKLPRILLLKIDGETHSYILDENKLTEKQLLQHANWKWYEDPPTDRCEIFLKIWSKLRALFNEEIEMHLNVMREWAGSGVSSNCRLPLNDHQIMALSKNPLFTIGMHTHTHPDLIEKELIFQTEEILKCKKSLKLKYNIDSNCLAYPYGRYDSNTIEAVKSSGIKNCFTTAATDVSANSDNTIMGRYQVFNEEGTSLKKLLKI